jgi:hypothetical protein
MEYNKEQTWKNSVNNKFYRISEIIPYEYYSNPFNPNRAFNINHFDIVSFPNREVAYKLTFQELHFNKDNCIALNPYGDIIKIDTQFQYVKDIFKKR